MLEVAVCVCVCVCVCVLEVGLVFLHLHHEVVQVDELRARRQAAECRLVEDLMEAMVVLDQLGQSALPHTHTHTHTHTPVYPLILKLQLLTPWWGSLGPGDP